MRAAESMRLERLLFVAAPGDVDPAPAWSQTLALARRAGASVTLLGVAREASADLAEAAALPAAQLAHIASDELREASAAWWTRSTTSRCASKRSRASPSSR